MDAQTLQAQITSALDTYSAKVVAGLGLPPELAEPVKKDLAVAMLSGMALTANFLVQNDGASGVNPVTLHAAVMNVGRGLGLKSEPLKPGRNG